MRERLAKALAEFGTPSDAILDLHGQPTPRHIRYLDLMRNGRPEAPVPDVVLSFQDAPVAYAYQSEDPLADVGRVEHLHRTLVYRADAPYLLVLAPGLMTIYALSLDDAVAQKPTPLVVHAEDPAARFTFQKLSVDPTQLPRGDPEHEVHQRLFSLLTASIERITSSGVSSDDAVSLTGRALFLRFILDRGILKDDEVSTVHDTSTKATELFKTSDSTLATCQWLDRVFNGDFLPVSLFGADVHRDLPQQALESLTDIMFRSHDRQTHFSWAAIDFAHVPAGLLSQVYEHQAALTDPVGRHSKGVYYTPRRIAEYLVREVFAAATNEPGVAAHTLHVLDPAAGGGVFLVAAFRELVRLHWLATGERPNTRQLRSILYEQLAGYEITETALRLTALSLYLTTIELDAEPRPVSKLKFKPLRPNVLQNLGGPSRSTIGTLGLPYPASRRFDIVLGNPPWTTVPTASARQIADALRSVVATRLGKVPAQQFTLLDGNPDLAFLWKAIDLAKDSGWIAFVMHARLLFKNTAIAAQARQQLLTALDVTGILNCADLRNTPVWDNMAAPFCMFFARNRASCDSRAFYFVSPYREHSLNSQGRLRIDSSAATPVTARDVITSPTLFKTVFRGTSLDRRLLVNLRSRLPSLADYWKEKGLFETQGFQVGTDKQVDASELIGKWPVLEGRTSHPGQWLFDPSSRPMFQHRYFRRKQERRAYRGPIVLVRKTPDSTGRKPNAFVCLSNVAYNESYYGYSTFGHESQASLAKYVGLMLNSDLLLWHALMTSGEFAVERDAIQKRDVDLLPMPRYEDLSPSCLNRLEKVASTIGVGGQQGRDDVSGFVREVYGLDVAEWLVIQDTLATGLPYSATRIYSQKPPRDKTVSDFVSVVEQVIRDFAHGAKVDIKTSQLTGGSPWGRITISTDDHPDDDVAVVTQLLDSADLLGASQIVEVSASRTTVTVALRMENRYWTRTRARELATRIVQEHLDDLLKSRRRTR